MKKITKFLILMITFISITGCIKMDSFEDIDIYTEVASQVENMISIPVEVPID